MGKTYNGRYKLTWMPDGRRWRKKYRGKVYYFAIREEENKTKSYARCLREWNNQLAKLKAVEASATLSEEDRARLAESIRLVEHGYEYEENGDVFEKIVVDIPPVGLPANGDAAADYVVKLFEDASGKLIDRKGDATLVTVGQEIAHLVQRKKSAADAGKLVFKTASRYEELLEYFVKWIGENTPIEDVSSRRLLDYHDVLQDEVTAGKRTPGGAKSLFQPVRLLLHTAYLRGSIQELPRILAVRNNLLSFGSSGSSPDLKRERNWIDDLDTFKKILTASEGRLRLWLLLMMNCGYQQTDVSELGRSEVDLKLGRICRKRSKGRKQQHVPKVDYLLWRETFDLLKQHKAPADAEPNINGDPRVLVNTNGTALLDERTDTDAIRLTYERLLKKLKIEKPVRKPLAAIRKTSSTLIRQSKYSDLRFYFLGHAPATVADRNYTIPSQEQFDECIRWLGEQYGVR